MINDPILQFIIEGEEYDEPAKDILGLDLAGQPNWLGSPADREVLYDEQGRKVASSRNLRGLRQWVRQYIVQGVEIRRKENGEGAMLVRLKGGAGLFHCVSHWASYGVMTNSLRNWRNLQGADLVVDGQPAGKIEYRNPALITEGLDDYEEDDFKGIVTPPRVRFYVKWFQPQDQAFGWYASKPFPTLEKALNFCFTSSLFNKADEVYIEEAVYLPDGHARTVRRHNVNADYDIESVEEVVQEGLDDYEEGDLKELLNRSAAAELENDRIWKRVGDSQWHFQVNDHQKLVLIYWGANWGEKPWEIRTLFDEMTLTVVHGTEEEVLQILEDEGYLPGGGMHNREMKFKGFTEGLEDEDDMKEVTLPGRDVQVNNEQWMRYNQDSVWTVQVGDDLWWKVGTTASYPDISVGTPHQTTSNKYAMPRIVDPDPEIWEQLLGAVVQAAKGKGFDRVTFVKSTPRVNDAMEEAVSALEAQRLIKIIGYSGATIKASLRGGLGEALDDEDDMKDAVLPVDELTLDQIKEIEPGFFNRDANRRFGTTKVYKYPGNYVVVKNTKEYRPATAFGRATSSVSYAIYQLTRTDDRPNGILLYKASADDLQDAKEMIKTQDFRPLIDRLRGRLGEAMEDDPLHMTPNIQSIHIVGRNWWRRGYGGNYFRADIYVNGEKVTTTPEQGGSEQQYLYDAFDWLERNNYIQRIRREGKWGGSVEGPQQVAERMGFKLTYEAYPVRRERDL